MSGRGKRREYSVFPQAVCALDLKQDDTPTTVQPPPLYPPLLGKPRPLLKGGEYDYMTTLREDLKERIRQAGYYMPSVTQNKDIERYSDKYQPWNTTKVIEWDRSLYPAELFEDGPPPKIRKKQRRTENGEKISELLVTKQKEESEVDTISVKDDPETEGENDDETVDDEEDEEDAEEGTDYVTNYYDNEENYPDEAEDHPEDTQLY